METPDLISAGIVIVIVILIGWAIYGNYQYEKICDKEVVCYYHISGGLFTSQNKIYVDCDDHGFVADRKRIIKEEVCKR